MKCPIESAPAQLPAIITRERTYSYGELNQLINGFYFQLSNQDLTIKATQTIETVLIIFAAIRKGVSITLLPPQQPNVTYFDHHKLSKKKIKRKPTLLNPDQIALIFQSSGSTGNPKNIPLTNNILQKNALGVIEYFNLDSRSSWHLSLPLFHVGGIAILFRSFMAHAKVTWGEQNNLASDLAFFKPSIVSLVPTQLHRLLQNKQIEKETIYLVGGAHTSDKLIKLSQSKNIKLYLTYGMTEMGSLITVGLYSLGKPLKYRMLKLAPDNQILVGGATLFQKTEWFQTRDLGQLDKNGNLIILGRINRMLIKGGENIHPEEIEAKLLSLEGVIEAKVISKKDDEYGEVPIAFVNSAKLNEAQLKKELEKSIPKFKIPSKIFELPSYLGLKIKLDDLRAYLADLESQ
ncbi:MAG: AMP-binding protein [Rhabdochlamydiaceae bacterium]|nr:AMP-binding protein [Candidatus Amphrikana amoebophyrae]